MKQDRVPRKSVRNSEKMRINERICESEREREREIERKSLLMKEMNWLLNYNCVIVLYIYSTKLHYNRID